MVRPTVIGIRNRFIGLRTKGEKRYERKEVRRLDRGWGRGRAVGPGSRDFRRDRSQAISSKEGRLHPTRFRNRIARRTALPHPSSAMKLGSGGGSWSTLPPLARSQPPESSGTE